MNYQRRLYFHLQNQIGLMHSIFREWMKSHRTETNEMCMKMTEIGSTETGVQKWQVWAASELAEAQGAPAPAAQWPGHPWEVRWEWQQPSASRERRKSALALSSTRGWGQALHTSDLDSSPRTPQDPWAQLGAILKHRALSTTERGIAFHRN